MAGNASNWFKPTGGPLKGRAVYLSRANQAAMMPYLTMQAARSGAPLPKIARSDILDRLNSPTAATIKLAAQRPKGAAITQQQANTRAQQAAVPTTIDDRFKVSTRPKAGPVTLNVATGSGATVSVTVPATRQGDLIMHRADDMERAMGSTIARRAPLNWVVTHPASGYKLGEFDTKPRALQAMAALNQTGIDWGKPATQLSDTERSVLTRTLRPFYTQIFQGS